MRSIANVFAAACAATALATVPVSTVLAADEYFLDMGDVKGNSIDPEHLEFVEVLTISGGITAASVGAAGAASQSPAQCDVFTFTARASRATPKLPYLVASGTHIAEVGLYVRRANQTIPMDYLVYKLKEVVVTSYRVVGGGDRADTIDQFSVSYGAFEVTYSIQKPDGTVGGQVSSKWSCVAQAAR